MAMFSPREINSALIKEKLCNFFICTIRANTNVILTEEWSRERETGDKFQRGILISPGEA